jgi:hypothetical protein
MMNRYFYFGNIRPVGLILKEMETEEHVRGKVLLFKPMDLVTLF